MGKVEGLAVVFHQEKPIAAPGDVAGDQPQAGHGNGDGRMGAPGGHVQHGNLAIGVKGGGDGADRGLDFMNPGLNPAGVGEGDHKTDGAVAAHAEITDVIKENDTGGARGILGLNEQAADHNIGAAGFVDDG